MKDDPDVEEILGSASHVTLYGFDLVAQAWVRGSRKKLS
jgi:mRNA-decapping enzyme 1B